MFLLSILGICEDGRRAGTQQDWTSLVYRRKKKSCFFVNYIHSSVVITSLLNLIMMNLYV